MGESSLPEGMHGVKELWGNKGVQAELASKTGDKVIPDVPSGSGVLGKHTDGPSEEEDVSGVGRVVFGEPSSFPS